MGILPTHDVGILNYSLVYAHALSSPPLSKTVYIYRLIHQISNNSLLSHRRLPTFIHALPQYHLIAAALG